MHILSPSSIFSTNFPSCGMHNDSKSRKIFLKSFGRAVRLSEKRDKSVGKLQNPAFSMKYKALKEIFVGCIDFADEIRAISYSRSA